MGPSEIGKLSFASLALLATQLTHLLRGRPPRRGVVSHEEKVLPRQQPQRLRRFRANLQIAGIQQIDQHRQGVFAAVIDQRPRRREPQAFVLRFQKRNEFGVGVGLDEMLQCRDGRLQRLPVGLLERGLEQRDILRRGDGFERLQGFFADIGFGAEGNRIQHGGKQPRHFFVADQQERGVQHPLGAAVSQLEHLPRSPANLRIAGVDRLLKYLRRADRQPQEFRHRGFPAIKILIAQVGHQLLHPLGGFGIRVQFLEIMSNALGGRLDAAFLEQGFDPLDAAGIERRSLRLGDGGLAVPENETDRDPRKTEQSRGRIAECGKLRLMRDSTKSHRRLR